ncbi:inorganic anion transporter, SulP family [Bordetella hinzii 5132]|uniref:SulP family inorganic anion transporter n=1 Tax=Bordetella hinzii TaxID=103855 RepID=UPI00045A675A|nr:SulP family inorganic anion transporter [Bordetella hinzii]KCB39809.1 inorganic anion transporter, SulP family [Bordetella hinzii 5132]QWF40643.1 SulP family inorganic anion transporter [Bordetella hinzii]QWF45190.1 SulP family inorganic anion transporter [Bordetella hinzii]QWF49726.1 SulP family inorganic anion transporter [Bordetella hinzii]QWF54261.1 SulP family inorganic anion transporter [Bordetella hinzii]
MSFLASFRREWMLRPRADILAGIVVALALIPEAIGFSIIAGVDPRVGLYASFSIAVFISLLGGRPGMISAATAAVAVLVGPLVKSHGVDYLFAATILMGVFQVIAGFLRLDLLMQYVSRSVITGFVNALAILIFMAQLPQLVGVTGVTYAMVAAGLAIIYLFPRLTRAVPSPLVAIVVLTALSVLGGLHVNTVGDMGALPSAPPVFRLPDVPFTFETLRIIFPYSLTMAAVGLLESMLTAQIVDDLTDTPSNKRRECKGQGIANFVTGFLGGMGGCAMIGQSVINVKSGGSGRLSTFVAGAFLLFLIVALGPWVARIPMPALVAVMIMVSIGTFSWASLRKLGTHPWQSSAVMMATVVVVVWTHDLARGVLVGVLLSGLFFAGKVRRLLSVASRLSPDGRTRSYVYCGQVFFASTERFAGAIDFREDVDHVVLDVSAAHFWDISAVGALDKAVLKLRREGRKVTVIGLNQASATLVGRFAVHDKPGAQAPGH